MRTLLDLLNEAERYKLSMFHLKKGYQEEYEFWLEFFSKLDLSTKSIKELQEYEHTTMSYVAFLAFKYHINPIYQKVYNFSSIVGLYNKRCDIIKILPYPGDTSTKFTNIIWAHSSCYPATNIHSDFGYKCTFDISIATIIGGEYTQFHI